MDERAGKSGGEEDEVGFDEFGLRGDDRFVFSLSGKSMVGVFGDARVCVRESEWKRGEWKRRVRSERRRVEVRVG